jgi:hypothetical protein
MSAPYGNMYKARALVTWLWDELAGVASVAWRCWPCRNSPGHIAAAQFALEVERARCASSEKDGRE